MENEFYDRIVYRKNAFLELKEYLSQNFNGKKVLLISTKSLVNPHLTEIMNMISVSGCNFKHYIAKNNFSNFELKQISELLTLENFDLYVVFGAGRATMVTKYFANIFCVPYIVCPSACSNSSFFSNICINPYDSTRSFKCDYPQKIFINESVIKTMPRKLLKQGVFFIMAIEEMLAMSTIENILFDKHNDMSQINKITTKLQKEIKGIMSGDVDSKLILTDIIIDLSYELDKVDIFKSATFNLYTIMQKIFLNSSEITGSGEIYLLASKTLLLCYKNLFMQKKIKQLELPNFPKIVKNIEKYSIFYKKINNFAYFNEILSKKELLTRLNNLKEEFLYQCNKRIEEQDNLLDVVKNYDDIFTYQTPLLSDVFTAVKVLPYVCENNFIVDLMGGLGLVNAF